MITVITALTGALPPVATLLAIVWYAIMIIDALAKWRRRRLMQESQARVLEDIE